MRHWRAIKTQRRNCSPLLLYTSEQRTPVGTWNKRYFCPSLLLALRSALLPVNLPALLWSGSDRRSQLAAPCQGCRGPNGDSDNHPSASPFTQNWQRKRPQENSLVLCSDSYTPLELNSIHVHFLPSFSNLFFLLQSSHIRLTLQENEIDSPPVNRQDTWMEDG